MKKYSGLSGRIYIPAILLMLVVLSSFIPPAPAKVSVKMEAKMLNKGKVFVVNADIFYQFDQGRMLTHYTKPMDYLFITNNKGEAKVYFPESNEVMVRQSAEFDTEKSVLYFFLANKLRDLGLSDMGFKITGTKTEEGLVITTWSPPADLLSVYTKVELVHEKYTPIFIAWYGPKNKLVKKIFYYDYDSHADFSMPMKVVEISYAPNGDSTINKMSYSQLLSGPQANSPYFNFKIPVNAKVKTP